jgi:hypothetical protein
MEFCRLTRDIGYQTSGESDLPRFGALDEVKTLTSCLSDLDYENVGLQWGAEGFGCDLVERLSITGT